jgi:hypothetical protein
MEGAREGDSGGEKTGTGSSAADTFTRVFRATVTAAIKVT